jgi:hypothetical protein
MATRSNIIIKFGSSKLYLYRHWDGYPAVTGADLVQKLRESKFNPKAFVNALLTEKRGGEGHDKDRAQYELTSEIHGDIQCLYRFEFAEDYKVRLGEEAFNVKIGLALRDPGDPVMTESKITVKRPLAQFVQMINGEIAQMNARTRELGYTDQAELLAEEAA